jgi:hypothetical protein
MRFPSPRHRTVLLLPLLLLATAAAAAAAGSPPVYTADTFAHRRQVPYEEQGREVTYLVRIHPGLPVYRLRLLPDRPGTDDEPPVGQIGNPQLHHVARVEISLADSAAVLQTIDVESVTGAQMLTERFQLVDIDLDGYADLALFREGGGTWGSYTYWLFDPASGRFVRNALSRDLDAIRSNGIVADPAAHTLQAPHLYYGCPLAAYDLYAVQDGRLQLIETHSRDLGHEPADTCVVVVARRVDGRLQRVDVQRSRLVTP